ncbi:MAG: endonuclease III [Candidatus Yonathbacteria bacterium CG10_big_fil_rev_8_21_14_0_10_43_136]|uniref:Endonuclease III n=1 Tax=Candidatus Nomurabacteria bacterium CG2_30_43_9 TaxID=1805283 RepID=A0A1J5G177_9BACT|nr:MAG: endonuclease III [Candidatus Nomurabacteria bacterium CG2_30_43_9]PIQ35785.1 MAG: endonuclease III [Candidatus Yonathbacteria bacterium CG17_big_fil_post_rev_8_21_14_2_50_43_9]PIR40801.1 MAG: endonuclease III [Candidatus Yonathbacteria bacterium CG10_big_fil_rev_8_21_14_0_10_43_136]PIX56874.1 MAG: endonuclease III [Candidatus Yonathbacteria bacterium CG_4_10_14_3_um_filter_43_12]PJC21931.1 MAG: endonuclease III [Candidatus Yonathbacteria bacterium CG_4_9_14_0_2_um_filter_43_16]
MNSKTHISKILRILKRLFPEPKCVLHYKKPFELLVAVILSAQCTDKKVNGVTKKLFKKYMTLNDYVSAKPNEFEKYIYSTGFYKAKAKNILAAARSIKKNFGGKIPRTMGEMVTIPGVGRKTANVVLGELYGTAEGISVDTHVIRHSRLLGLTKHKDAVKIERDLMKVIPKKDWVRFSHLLILYGREYCTARCKHKNCPLAPFHANM